jgi:hypothetical protein
MRRRTAWERLSCSDNEQPSHPPLPLPLSERHHRTGGTQKNQVPWVKRTVPVAAIAPMPTAREGRILGLVPA